jgi:hypothetical protein
VPTGIGFFFFFCNDVSRQHFQRRAQGTRVAAQESAHVDVDQQRRITTATATGANDAAAAAPTEQQAANSNGVTTRARRERRCQCGVAESAASGDDVVIVVVNCVVVGLAGTACRRGAGAAAALDEGAGARSASCIAHGRDESRRFHGPRCRAARRNTDAAPLVVGSEARLVAALDAALAARSGACQVARATRLRRPARGAQFTRAGPWHQGLEQIESQAAAAAATAADVVCCGDSRRRCDRCRVDCILRHARHAHCKAGLSQRRRVYFLRRRDSVRVGGPPRRSGRQLAARRRARRHARLFAHALHRL